MSIFLPRDCRAGITIPRVSQEVCSGILDTKQLSRMLIILATSAPTTISTKSVIQEPVSITPNTLTGLHQLLEEDSFLAT